MKKAVISLGVILLLHQNSKACAWEDPDGDYFNLFTQTIIRDKSYTPFLLSSSPFYEADNITIIDDNLQLWKSFFNNKLSYDEVKTLVYKLPLQDIISFKDGCQNQAIFQKLVAYQNYREGLDYLIEAKKLNNLRINRVANDDDNTYSFYYDDEIYNLASTLDYENTLTTLINFYKNTSNKEIKLRYAYQIVRFEHYNRNYDKAVKAFSTYVEPLGLKNAIYYMALEQMAGAQSGLGQKEEANWNFFQVFINSNSRKQTAYISIKLSSEKAFEDLLSRAKNDKEKIMAYFLLGYQGFNNPLPMMEKIYEIDPNSEALKVLQARAINELERYFLPYYYYNEKETKVGTSKTTPSVSKTENKASASFWDKIVSFFKNLFGMESSEPKVLTTEESKGLSDDELLNHPNRLPVVSSSGADEEYNKKMQDYIEQLEKLTEKVKTKSDDEFWVISEAYIKFLQKDYKSSSSLLQNINTSNQEYLTQIDKMKLLNDILSQPRIDSEFEQHIMKTYPDLVTAISEDRYSSSEAGFITDILANRYFLQGERAKSFLMSNKLSGLQDILDIDLVRDIEAFYKRKNKNAFENSILAKNIDTGEDTQNFINVLYGDYEMRSANFKKALDYYTKASGFIGIPRYEFQFSEDGSLQSNTPVRMKIKGYNGYNNVSSLVFGHNVWVSYTSPESESMKAESFISDFKFIKNNMNKKELAEAVLKLIKIAKSNDINAAHANQLLGNFLYNTSILGYYRHYFVMDIDNTNGGKYSFLSDTELYTPLYYYKSFPYTNTNVGLKSDNFDVAISYYKKALERSTDRETQARILFQMASAEQGKYYRWEANQTPNWDYSDANWEEKQNKFQQELDKTKNQNYRNYFTELKTKYSDTETSKSLMGSCSYYKYFMQK
ncbi:hypothetical protein [Riemerella anatipestifer]|uniref:hypothetical protein n=1 Tax=Riemerella anatipestifer TaxID=34085 RepID=UPI0007ED6C8A|nr:hypothetical protein [Riemerella anatipestifer]AZZ57598.1 hypothetical protein AWB57_00275 [Riemerella anatipestifer]MCW0512112.1 hypothetical protein [Riemerella anatipestifer]MCW0520622.1 hypothetical protein [Riemerella anatipestifer]MDY3391901.1 hypothetical protein [Riemerella anatipestifer]MDY3519880.1 hypothetical protein [Riemerella anatipestifer]